MSARGLRLGAGSVVPPSWRPAMEAGHGVEGLTPLMQEGPEATLKDEFSLCLGAWFKDTSTRNEPQ